MNGIRLDAVSGRQCPMIEFTVATAATVLPWPIIGKRAMAMFLIFL